MTDSAQPAARRKRRTAEEARRAILEAAQKRLAECGPEEIRLQDIASDLGISHPAILHHFGSRDALMGELSRHALRSLNADLVAALRSRSERDLSGWLDRVFETLGDRGHARLLAWSLLTGRLGTRDDEERVPRGSRPRASREVDGAREEGGHQLRDLAEAVHARRTELGHADAPLEESIFAVQLVSAALLGDALLGPVLRRSAGLDGSDESNERFRAWLGERVEELLVPPVAAPDGDR